MYNFSSHLLEDEKILYQGQSVPGKGGKDIGGLIFVICFSLMIQIFVVFAVVNGMTEVENETIFALEVLFGPMIFFLVAGLFLFIGIHGLFDNLVLKKKRIAGNFYCLTNMRVMKYEKIKDKLVFGYLKNYEEIYCSSTKDNFGDVCFEIFIEEETDDRASELETALLNATPENMPFIYFESIQDPERVMNLAIEAKEKILK